MWPVEKGILESPSITNRNLFAQKFKEKDPDAILRKYAYFDGQEMSRFYNSLFDLIPEVQLSGVGLELGAGTCGFSASVCNRFADIENIYAIEVVPDVVQLLQPKTISSICGEQAKKIIRVIGSFNRLELEDNSVDFCVEVESLHHSSDLTVTLKEVARVMKKGSTLLILDRSHNNKLTQEQRKFMLEVEYNDEWKIENGYNLKKLTRQENGEREIKLEEWEDALMENGFILEKRLELRTADYKKLFRGFLLTLPFKLRKWLNILPSRVAPQDGEILWMLGYLLGINSKNDLYKPSLRDYTVFVARR